MSEQNLELKLKPSGLETSRFIEGRTTPKNERLLRELAKAIEQPDLLNSSYSRNMAIAAGLAGLAAIVLAEGGCVTIVEGGAIASKYTTKDPLTKQKVTTEVLYPPEFTCEKRLADFDTWQTLDGSQRTELHTGIDVTGHTIIAPANGKVLSIYQGLMGGYKVALLHTPKDLDKDGIYVFSYFLHLKEVDGKNSALKYMREGQTVHRGQPIAEVGRTGTMAGSAEHLHLEVWINDTGTYDKRNDGGIIPHNHKLINPHLLWAKHPMDDKVKKYITIFEENQKLYKGGFTYPIHCPPKKN